MVFSRKLETRDWEFNDSAIQVPTFPLAPRSKLEPVAWGQFAPVDTFQLSGFHHIPMIIGALNDCVDQQSED